ncbi:MAG: diaminopimelate epimerase [Leptospirales bacterium]|nr:diaminopimelate epimerase [Leptospirales bacterium]
MIKFTKMHGIGNDYIYINAIEQAIKNPAKLALEMSHRHYGIGSDGLILIMESKITGVDFKMRIFNSDGSEAEMCGNGIRCFAKYVYERGFHNSHELSIETLAGVKTLKLNIKNRKIVSVTVDMGEPIILRGQIPMIGKEGTVINERLDLLDGSHFYITAVSMGNPHVVIFVEDTENFPVEKYGPVIENHNLFPQRTNVEFIQVLNRKEIVQRTWERGSGETMACGTGASAATVASILTGQTERALTVHLKGGDLEISWEEKSGHVYMTGPAVDVFDGEWKA